MPTRKLPLEILVLVGLWLTALVVLTARVKPNRDFTGDGFSYYAYLRSAYFDRDLYFRNEYLHYIYTYDRIPHHLWNTPTPTGLYANPFSVGPTLLWAPFFLVQAEGEKRSIISPLSPNQASRRGQISGYSPAYLRSLFLGTVFYATLTLVLIFLLIRLYFRFLASLLATLSMALATPFVYYTLAEPLMSHVFSAFGVSLFLLIWGWGKRSRPQPFALGTSLGLAMLTRWQNLLFGVVLLPDILPWIRLARHRLILLAIGLLTGFLPQMLTWKHLYGSWLLVPQGGSFFRLRSPAVWDFLTSAKHGFFYWHPATVIGVIGVLVLAKKKPRFWLGFVLALALQVYLNSALTDWSGGGSFGARRMTSSLPLLVVGTAAIWSVTHKFKYLIALFLVLLVGWNFIWFDQYSHGLISHDEAVTIGQVWEQKDRVFQLR